jgi:single-strand DNA-binding protein|tara:strand:- start:2831 stop:3172 length:342 start_codon:yes stop_codon:yes gene_type:complete
MFNNRINLKGNLTKDPTYKEVNNTKVLNFRVAVNEKVGKDKEETTFIDVEGWGSHADYAENVSLVKGDRVIIEGRLRQKSWSDGSGQKRTNYFVSPSNFSKVVTPTGGRNRSV